MLEIDELSRKFMTTAIAKNRCFIKCFVPASTPNHATGQKVITCLHHGANYASTSCISVPYTWNMFCLLTESYKLIHSRLIAKKQLSVKGTPKTTASRPLSRQPKQSIHGTDVATLLLVTLYIRHIVAA